MATGDQGDLLSRLKSVLPPWFGNPSPILDATLTGIATHQSWIYSLLQFARQQTRIKTVSGGWLDMLAWDYFGARFPRQTGESDASFRARVLPEVLRERGTRKGVIKAVTDLTGISPIMIEFTNPTDCGTYHGPYIGYGVAGHYGSLLMPDQAFLIAYRPSQSGIPNIPGYGAIWTTPGNVLGGYGKTGRYSDLSEILGPVTDAMIYAAVAATQASGVVIWTQIQNAPGTSFAFSFDFSDPRNSWMEPLV